ncbi:hypothetical protein SprV_0902797800 [Sparganum proliferum]
MSRLLENTLSNVRASNDCRGRQYDVLLSAIAVESVDCRNAGCSDAEEEVEEEEEEEEEAVEFGGGIESELVRQDETEQLGHNNTMQYPKPQSRKLTFIPQLEGIEEVSEEEEEEEDDCEDDCGSTNDNNGVKREVREGGQQQNVHAGGDADCLAVVSESTIILAAYEDIQVVLFLLHREVNVREDGVEMFLEFQHLNSFDDDVGIIHIPDPELQFVVLEDQRL